MMIFVSFRSDLPTPWSIDGLTFIDLEFFVSLPCTSHLTISNSFMSINIDRSSSLRANTHERQAANKNIRREVPQFFSRCRPSIVVVSHSEPPPLRYAAHVVFWLATISGTKLDTVLLRPAPQLLPLQHQQNHPREGEVEQHHHQLLYRQCLAYTRLQQKALRNVFLSCSSLRTDRTYPIRSDPES